MAKPKDEIPEVDENENKSMTFPLKKKKNFILFTQQK